MPDELHDLLARTAHRTLDYDFTVWFWGDAIAVDGLLDAAQILGNERLADHAATFVNRWAGQPRSWTDHLTPGAAVLRLANERGDERLLDAAARLGQWLTETVPRVGDVPLYRPDVPMYRHAVWVDTMYHLPVFYARLAAATGDASFYRWAAAEWTSHLQVLRDPSRGPLLAHSWDTGMRVAHGFGWGRGQGWALLGLVDLLDAIPADLEQRRALTADLEDLASAIRTAQDTTGLWHTLMHDRDSYLETSTATFVAAALLKARRLGYLGSDYDECARTALSAAVRRVDREGGLWGVSACTYAGVAQTDDVQMYRTLPVEVNVWGQGSALRCFAEAILAGWTPYDTA